MSAGGWDADIQQGALIYTGAPSGRVTGRCVSSKQNRGSGIDSFRRKILLVIQSHTIISLPCWTEQIQNIYQNILLARKMKLINTNEKCAYFSE